MNISLRIPMIVLALSLLTGCKPSGPASTHTTSGKFQTLAERTALLNQYVSFRRNYETLDFDIDYQNNGGGGVPGPSDWDIRLIATVPASEVGAWIPVGAKRRTTTPSVDWLKSVPTTLDLSGLDEWYGNDKQTVGIDRQRRIIAYRLSNQ
jgi:hypothetical protein